MKEIHKAAKNGDINEIMKQINLGSNVDFPADDGCTPLHYAVFAEKIETVRFLIDINATVNAQNKKGISPLHMAANSGNEFLICILLESGANPNAKDNAVCVCNALILSFF